jgi:hypothetical protein
VELKGTLRRCDRIEWKAELTTCNQIHRSDVTPSEKIGLKAVTVMNEVHQLANALLTMVFAAVMLVVGHLYIEKRSTKIPTIPAAQAFVLWTNPL